MNRSPLLLTAASLALGCMPAVVPSPPPESPLPVIPDTSLATRAVPPASEWHTADDSVFFLATQWSFAVSTGDTVVAARILDDDFIAQSADGTMRTKPAVLEEMSRAAYPLIETSTADVRVQHIGGVGIVVSRIWWASTNAYPHTREQYRVTDVFVRRPDGWRLASEQMALIQPLQITREDSAAFAREVKNLLEGVRQYGRAHMHTETADAPSAFSGAAPDRIDDAGVPDRVMSITDLPRSVYFDTTAPPVAEPFTPERLRIQLLSQDAGLATFEIHFGNVVYRRTLVFRRERGRWLIVHVHASSVRELTTMDVGAVCDTVPPRDSNPTHAGARVPVPRPPRSDVGTIVGVVTERSTGRPLEAASVIFDRVVTPAIARIPGEQVQTDANGGFSTIQSAGRYAVRARRLGYVQAVDTVMIRAGTVDTLRFALQYHSCRGY